MTNERAVKRFAGELPHTMQVVLWEDYERLQQRKDGEIAALSANSATDRREIELQKRNIAWQSKEIDTQAGEIERLRTALQRLLTAYEALSDARGCVGDPPDPEAAAAREALGDAVEPRADHVCGTPDAMCDTECMERAYRPLPVTNGIKCTHCNGKGVETQHYDEEQGGWSDPDVPCATCEGTGRIRTVEQYLKTVPADWHQDSSVQTWFPLLEEEIARLRRAEESCMRHHGTELKSSEHLYVPVSSGNDTCSVCGQPKRQCSALRTNDGR
jgi:hypothetical protein